MTHAQAAPIRPEDLEDPAEYEKERRERLVAMGRYKTERRMALADDVSLLFEDRKTIQHQIQEMIRLEGDDPDAVKSVFQHYEDLMPNGRDLVATLFVEVKEAGEIKPRLRHYARLADALRLKIGDLTVRPKLLGEAGDDDAATAVTYMRFPVPDDAEGRLDQAEITVDHANLKGSFPLPSSARSIPR